MDMDSVGHRLGGMDGGMDMDIDGDGDSDSDWEGDSQADLREVVERQRREIAALRRDKRNTKRRHQRVHGKCNEQLAQTEQVQVVAAQLTPSQKQAYIGGELVRLMELAGVLTEKREGGRENLSLRSGILVQVLQSMCNVSMEKQPMTQAVILQQLFGIIPEESRRQLVYSSHAYDNACKRSMDVYASNSQALFVHGAAPAGDCVVHACVVIDASHKKKDLVVKNYTYSSVDGVVRAKALLTDLSHSKKAVLSAELSIQSMTNELGEGGMVRIMGGCGDNFGLTEIAMVLASLDAERSESSEEVRRSLDVVSTVVPGLTYRYDVGDFAAGRLFSCFMHAFERIVKCALDGLLQAQGLANSAAAAQGLHSLAYYLDKNGDVLNAFNLASVGGGPTRLKDLPKPIRTKFKTVSLTRWLSAEKSSQKCIELSDVEATPFMKTLVQDYFGGENSEGWQDIAKYCTCFSDDDSISYLALALVYTANHSPGGTSGDNYTRLIQIVAFLGSPIQRVCIKLAAGLLGVHLQAASFYDGKSAIDPTVRAMSTRAIELVPHNRHLLAWLARLDHDWTAELSVEYAFLQKEKQRAVSLGLCKGGDVDGQEVEDVIQAVMRTATPKMLEMGMKYLHAPMMTDAMSLLHITDPTLHTCFAQGLLLALASNGSIVLSDADKQQWEQPSEAADADRALLWTLMSDVLAAPGVSLLDYRNEIRRIWTLDGPAGAIDTLAESKRDRSIRGKVAGYGLWHPTLVGELKTVARGEVRRVLSGAEGVGGGAAWTAGKPVAEYWQQFKNLLPGLADSLIVNFGYLSVTSTITEQSFTQANNQTDANSSMSTIQSCMSCALNMRGTIARDMGPLRNDRTEAAAVEGVTAAGNQKPMRPFRNQGDMDILLHELDGMSQSCIDRVDSADNDVTIRTGAQIRGPGGLKIGEMLAQDASTWKELHSNEKKGLMVRGGAEVGKAMEMLHEAGLARAKALPVDGDELLLREVRSKKWDKTSCINYLIAKLPHLTAHQTAQIKGNKLRRKDTDSENDRSLQEMVLDYWATQGIATVDEARTQMPPEAPGAPIAAPAV
ncbi:hypothetical protein B484DRAFT_469484 [Ochromonadaceae sp. CCMP2298]|nr:hypothetical protein B484DRAFT_469484 [Ochromonadaceae sp. CCMP2298]